ncbi:MAG TPA: addiction module protein [Verrucomicrobiae bacterium]|jgi:hypothetical protein|nr:addiction module protein [Verrucomicrobiae bacterium]
MNATTEQVFIEALSLPTQSRAELAQKLLASLNRETDSAEIEAAWAEEAVGRCNAYDQGKIPERDSMDVLRDAYKKVG